MIAPGEGGPARDEQGYALVFAVAAIAVFATLALAMITATRITVSSASGELDHARAEAAAQAGLAIAVHGLVGGDQGMLAALGGNPREITFDGNRLMITISDERGRVPLAHIEEPAMERMLEQVGLSGENLEIARDSLLDWLDDDNQPRPHGAEAGYYAAQGIGPRNGIPDSIGELARVRGIGPQAAERLRAFVTVDPDVELFDPAMARPQSLAVMSASGSLDAEAVDRARENGANRVALGTAVLNDIRNHPLAIRVTVATPTGGRAYREAVVLITGRDGRPVIFHAVR